MAKETLPVILLNNIVLLPNNDIRLEFENDASKNILEMSEVFTQNKVLVVSHRNDKELADNLPLIGVVGIVSHKLALPDGKVRVVITGLYRASVHEFKNIDNHLDVLEATISVIEDIIDPKEEKILIRKIFREVENYLKQLPYMSGNLLASIANINSLSKLLDIAIIQMPISIERLYEYLYEVKQQERCNMFLNDLYRELELINLEKTIDSKVKKELDTNQKEYLLREKIKVIKQELGDITIKDEEIDDLKKQASKLKAPDKIKERLNREIKKYESLPSMSPELNIVRNYIDWILELPWEEYTSDNENLKEVRKRLDSSHYGLDKVKTRIIEFLAVKQKTNNLKSPILCLVGAPGVGKTSLAFSIAAAINRKFVKISVGGVHDEAEIVGHRRTYIGANPGRIIQGMRKAKCSNPVFLIDEIDKMTKDYKGDPASALLEILDPEQNRYFSDNYIEEEYDLSKVMFIATANYMDDIPEALKDRLEIVYLSGYTEYEKLDIAKKHLIAKICKDHGLERKKLSINEKAILDIIRGYTKEAGVRELERQLSTIIRKIVTEIVVDNNIESKFTITTNNIIKYLGKPKYRFSKKTETRVGVVNGLAYTYFGGDTLPIEVNYYKGNGNLVLTGSLGEIMKESAHIAMSYIKSNNQQFNVDYQKVLKSDIHIHVPEGAIHKDGPSAGVTLTTALISALAGLKVNKTIAMTGEITLRGHVLPIGGLKEKSIGAHRSGIKTIFIPYDNRNDLDDIPSEIKKDITFIPVKKYQEIYEYLTNKI
jgi:ATP-dependent Lon protease